MGCLLTCTCLAQGTGNTPVFVLEGPVESKLGNFAITPDSQTLVLGRYDGTVEIRSAVTGEFLDRIVHTEAVYFESLSPDGQYFLSRNHEKNTFWLWNLPREKILHTLEMPTNVRESVVAAFSPHGREIVTCEKLQKRDPLSGTTHQLGIWDAETGERLRTISSPVGDLQPDYYRQYVRNFVFSPDGERALLTYTVKNVDGMRYTNYHELWDTVSWKPTRGLLRSWASSFTPDSQFYACTICNRGHQNGLLNVETGRIVSRYGSAAGYLQLSPDGKTAISSDSGNQGYTLWSPDTGELLRFYDGYDPFPEAVFYPSSRAVAIRYNLDNEIMNIPNAIAVWDISDLVQSGVGKEAGEY